MSAIAIAYGLSKFLMGLVSDRSNPRYFLPFGLLVSAGVMFIFGFAPWATSSVTMMFILLFINGWAQGMGWPPSGRTMVHWWSQKERGGVVSVWNVAHNVGGGLIGPLFLLGMAWFNDWHAAPWPVDNFQPYAGPKLVRYSTPPTPATPTELKVTIATSDASDWVIRDRFHYLSGLRYVAGTYSAPSPFRHWPSAVE